MLQINTVFGLWPFQLGPYTAILSATKELFQKHPSVVAIVDLHMLDAAEVYIFASKMTRDLVKIGPKSVQIRILYRAWKMEIFERAYASAGVFFRLLDCDERWEISLATNIIAGSVTDFEMPSLSLIHI